MSQANPDLFYKHSGRSGISIPLITLIGFPLIAVLSAVYSYIVVYCPVIGYVNVVFLLGYVFIGGIILGALAKAGKSRSPGLLSLLGLTAGLIGLYFAWVFFIVALLRRGGEDASVLALTLDPAAVWRLAAAINEQGWWGASGIAQWALVSIEALVMVGGLTLIASAAIEREAFCEDCGTWCEPFETMHMQPTDEILATKADKIDHLELLALEEAAPTDYPRIEAEVLQCTGCKSSQAIRFKRLTQVMEDGELNEESEDIPGVLMQKSKRPLPEA